MRYEARPRFKPIHFVRKPKPHVLRLGELFESRAAEIEDEDGAIEQLIQLMDGKRTVDDICCDLSQSHPQISKHEVMEAIEELAESGFVYDQSARDQINLTKVELERYKTNLNHFTFYSDLKLSPWHIQEKLKSTHVTIIGMGGCGSSVLLNLAGLGVQQVRIVDFDEVELSNLNRQILFHEGTVGRPKVKAAKEFMARFHSDMQIEPIRSPITSVEDAKNVIQGTDIVVLSADQPYFLLERWVNQACVEKGIPLFGGGTQITWGTYYAIIPGETGCIDCLHLAQSEQNPEYAELVDHLLNTKYAAPNSTILPHLMILFGVLSGELMKWITGIGPLLIKGKVLSFDFMSLEKRIHLDFSQKRADCPTCGEGKGNESIFKRFQEAEHETQSG